MRNVLGAETDYQAWCFPSFIAQVLRMQACLVCLQYWASMRDTDITAG